jgi:hypothetical protein
MVMFIVSLMIWLFNVNLWTSRRTIYITLIGLLFTLPYLGYTYSLTGRIFYWSSFGGNNLYWMSSPYEGEWGSWHDYKHFKVDSKLLKNAEEYFKEYHENDLESILQQKGLEQDDAFKEAAVRNIQSYPKKYLLNCVSNLSRMIFNFPYNYKLQTPRTLIRLPWNGLLVVLALFSLIPTILNWRKLSYSIRLLLFFTIIYLGGSIFGSAETRMFTIVVPVFILWISIILDKTIRIRLYFKESESV